MLLTNNTQGQIKKKKKNNTQGNSNIDTTIKDWSNDKDEKTQQQCKWNRNVEEEVSLWPRFLIQFSLLFRLSA